MRDDLLPSLHLSVSQAAGEMGVARQTLHRIMAGRAAVTPDMALRLARLSGTRAETWLTLQQRHDLWHAEQHLTAALAAIPAHRLPRGHKLGGEARHVG